MKKSVLIALIPALLLIVLPVVSAEILVGQTNALYNFGDEFNMNITISPANNAKGFFTAKLICSSVTTLSEIDVDEFIESLEEDTNETTEDEVVEEVEVIEDTYGEVEIYRSPENILGGEQKVISISTSLDSFFIGNLEGDCIISASYNGEISDSQTFEISKGITVEFGINGFAYDPGTAFELTGTAVKINSVPLEGFVTISIPGLGLNISSVVIEGDFGASITIPSNARSGEYNILVNAYEKDELDERINEGSSGDTMRVEQIVSDLGIALNSQSIIPGTEIIYTLLLFDQAGNEVTEDIEVVIYNAEEEIFSEGLVEAGSAVTIPTLTSFAPGYWKLETSFKELSARKAIYIEELETVSYEMTNDTLNVTNIGNVIYNKPVEISIGEETRVEEVYLEIGEGIVFTLKAPSGDYEISVSDGESSQSMGTAALTGKAISVRELGEGGAFSGFLLWLWIILILVIIGIIIYFYRRKRNKTAGATPKIIGEPISQKDAPVTKGRREEASVVALKIKNPRDIESSSGPGSSIEAINNALIKAKESNAKIYVDGDYRVILLSPALTKKEDNHVQAIKIAQTIEKDLNEYNKSAEKKIEFGVGSNAGDMIVESRNGKFKFTSLGNTITLAKKISNSADSEVLISENIHGRVAGKVKSMRSADSDYRKVTRIVDRGRHSSFISKFKNRQKKEKK